MSVTIEITDLSMPELTPFTDTSELRLMREHGLFIAESPKVIRTALDAGFTPVSLLADRRLLSGQASDIAGRVGDAPIYTASSDTLEKLTGFRLTQGVLCAMRRKPPVSAESVLSGARRIAVLEDIMNQTNTGAIFRSAAALGMDAVILTRSCSDPLFRRSVRVSMGTVFQMPWAYIDGGSPEYIEKLREMGFPTAAMALCENSTGIDDPGLMSEEKLAVVFGTEGDGLKKTTIGACDYTVTIPMHNGVDSLNVAAASAIAFWQLCSRRI